RTSGKHNASWDQKAVDALWSIARVWSSRGRDGDWNEVLRLTELARAAGCDDPMVQYCYCRTKQMIKGPDQETVSGLLSASYSLRSYLGVPVRGLYAECAALQCLGEAASQHAPLLDFARQDLPAVLKDTPIPIDIVYQGCSDFVKASKSVTKDSKAAFDFVSA